jgi:hypothetical protein
VRAYVRVPTRAFVPHVQLADGTHELALRDCHGRILVGTDGRATTVRFETLTIDRHSVRCPLVVFTPNRNGGSFLMRVYRMRQLLVLLEDAWLNETVPNDRIHDLVFEMHDSAVTGCTLSVVCCMLRAARCLLYVALLHAATMSLSAYCVLSSVWHLRRL